MAKTLRTAAMVVGAVALVATGVGAIGAGALAATAASAAGTLTLVASGLSLAASLTAKKPSPSVGGLQTRFKADPLAGIPYAIGRTLVGGNIVYHEAHGDDNVYNSYGTVLSLGPIDGIESFLVEKQPVAFSGSAATGYYGSWMWQTRQIGALPESAALTTGAGTPPGWTEDHKLSGLAAAMWTLKFDKKGKVYSAGTPQPGWVGKWVLVYDPRLDDTYPGGSGDCRALDESTYVWSENPYLHALTWLLGRWQNGARVIGVGAPLSMIDVPAFVEGANVADTNEWTVGGQVYSTDSKWNVLKQMLQAGGGEPLRLGAKISCLVNTPRVSLATITRDDILGDASVAATQPRRERFNSVVPVYRSEAHGWEVVSAAPVDVPEYVIEDGEQRTREIVYPLVQDVDQAAELALYDIVNAREFGPVELQLKPKWLGYKPGDCVSVDVEELGLEGQDVLLLNRTLEPSGLVTIVARSETTAKHAFALGQTGTPPPTPSVTGDDLNTVAAPAADAWELIGTEFSDNGSTIPALVITGAVENVNAEAVLFELQADGSSEWAHVGMEPPTITRKEITGVTPGTGYFVAVSYRVRGVLGARRILGPESVGELISGDARREINNTSRRIIRDITDLSAGVTRLTLEASRTRAMFRDAGIVIDPSNGQVRIFALDQLGERISAAELSISAFEDNAELIAALEVEVGTKAAASTVAVLSSRVDDAEGDIAVLTAAVTDLDAELDGKASSSALSSLSASVSEVDGEVATLAAALIEVDSDLGDASATASLALSTAQGEEAIVALQTDVNGRITSQTINGATSDITFRSNSFNIEDDDGSPVMSIIDDVTTFYGDVRGLVAGVDAEQLASTSVNGGITAVEMTAIGASAAILVVMTDGTSRFPDARFGFTGMSGNSTIGLVIQASVDGGSWTDIGSQVTAVGDVGEPVDLTAGGTYANTSGTTQTVRFRAVASSTAPGVTGTVPATSFFRA